MAEIPLKVKATYDGKQLDKGLNRLKGQVGTLQKSMAAAFAGFITIQGLRMLTRATSEVIKLSGSVEALKTQLDGTGVSFDTLIKQLREATAGQVSLRDLVQSTNSAIALLGNEAVPRLSELAEVAAKASTALGTDLTRAFSDLVTGIGRQSRLILDNLGIIIDAKKAYDDYAKSIGKAADELTEIERKQAFLNAAIEQGNEKFGDVEAIVNPLQRVAAAAQDLVDVLIGKLFGVEAEEGIDSLADAIRGLVESLEGMDAETIQDIAKSLATIAATGAGAAGLGAFARNLATIGLTAGLFKEQIFKALKPLTEFIILARKMATGNTFTMASIASLSPPLARFAQHLGIALRSVENFIGVLRVSAAPLALLSGLFATWRENVDNLWSAVKNLVFAIGDLFGFMADLLRMIGININAMEALQVVLDTIAVVINLIGTGIVAITGFINIVSGVIRDLSSALRTGTLEWDNFTAAIDKTIDNLTIVINKIRELLGFDPIKTVEDAAADAAFAALSQTSQQQDLLNRFFVARTSPGRAAGGGEEDDVVISGTGTTVAKNKADQAAALQAFREFNTAEKQATIERRAEKDAIVEAMEAMQRETDKLVASFIDLIEQQKISKAILDDQVKLAKQIGGFGLKFGVKGSGFGSAQFGPGGEKVSGETKSELLARLRREQLEEVFEDFLSGMASIFEKFAKEIGDISELFGGGAGGAFANQLLGLGGEAFGASLFGEGGFAAGGAFAETGALAGLGPGLAAAGAIGVAGFALNRIFGGDKPIEIDQPLDIRIVDIETHLLNFFNFRGLEGQTFQSDFRETFESGLFH